MPTTQTFRYARGDCQFGPFHAAWSDHGLAAVVFGDDGARDLHRRLGGADWVVIDGAPVRELSAFLDAPSGTYDAPIDPRGTTFQRRVWDALRTIPSGTTTTYAALADTLGLSVGAARAVGAACGANPLAVVIPCHRVVGRSGSLTGYRWGVSRKAALLARECATPMLFV